MSDPESRTKRLSARATAFVMLGVLCGVLAIGYALLVLPSPPRCLAVNCSDFNPGGFLDHSLTGTQVAVLIAGVLLVVLSVGVTAVSLIKPRQRP